MRKPSQDERPTKAELLAPAEMACADCGRTGTAYALPLPGAFFCPCCSPAWLGAFLAWRNRPEALA